MQDTNSTITKRVTKTRKFYLHKKKKLNLKFIRKREKPELDIDAPTIILPKDEETYTASKKGRASIEDLLVKTSSKQKELESLMAQLSPTKYVAQGIRIA